MLRCRFFSAAVLVSVIVIPATAKSRAAFRAAEDTRADAQSNQEFRAQVAAIVQSYREGDTTKGRQLIEQFSCRMRKTGSPNIWALSKRGLRESTRRRGS